MTLFKYLDFKYRSLNISLQKDYSLFSEGELKAAYALIQWQRTFFKCFHMPLLFFKYAWINLGLMKEPEALHPKEVLIKEVISPEETPVEIDNVN